jgi:hypothetical protein
MIDPEEAVLLFAKWRDESTPLRLVANLACGTFAFDCELINADSASAAFRLHGKGNSCEFSLEGFSFEYAEPRTLEESLFDGRETVSIVLAVRRETKERLVFMELARL